MYIFEVILSSFCPTAAIRKSDGIRQSADVYVSMQRVPKYAQYPNTQQYPKFLTTKTQNQKTEP